MKNADIKSLLDHLKRSVPDITEQAKNGEICKVDVKNSLENLRSILDYIAHDILLGLKTKSRDKLSDKVFFPYGQRKNHFKNSIQKNLPKLDQYLPDVYEVIEKHQYFKCKDNWLYDLCFLTNDAKHNRLSETENQQSVDIKQPGIHVNAGQGANIVISGNTYNGEFQDTVVVEPDGDIVVHERSGKTSNEINNCIKFHGKELEVAPFLEKCLDNIEKLVVEIENGLENA